MTTPIPKLSIVMPAYNEEASIESVVLAHAELAGRLTGVVAWEIVCVDDASTDRTAEILGNLAVRLPRLRVVGHEKNQGIFGSFRDCFRAAQGTHIYATGSDGQWPPENLIPMLEALKGGADLVVGVRTNRAEVYTVWRRVISGIFNFLPRVIFRVPVKDAGSVKLGRKEIFDVDLISKSPFFEAERIIRAHRQGYKVVFVPIRFAPRQGGKAAGAKLGNLVRSMRDLLRCTWFYNFGINEKSAVR